MVKLGFGSNSLAKCSQLDSTVSNRGGRGRRTLKHNRRDGSLPTHRGGRLSCGISSQVLDASGGFHFSISCGYSWGKLMFRDSLNKLLKSNGIY